MRFIMKWCAEELLYVLSVSQLLFLVYSKLKTYNKFTYIFTCIQYSFTYKDLAHLYQRSIISKEFGEKLNLLLKAFKFSNFLEIWEISREFIFAGKGYYG